MAGESTRREPSGPSPEDTLRRHYRLIDDGDYDAAWRIFHPAYRNGAGARWVETKVGERPRINLDSLDVVPAGRLGRGMLRLNVQFVAADTAGESEGVCRRFVGWTRMQRVSGKWFYRPGEVDGVEPGLKLKPISASDSRCQRILE